jgi:hypothetical protein
MLLRVRLPEDRTPQIALGQLRGGGSRSLSPPQRSTLEEVFLKAVEGTARVPDLRPGISALERHALRARWRWLAIARHGVSVGLKNR